MKPVDRTRILLGIFDLFLVLICTLFTAYLHGSLSLKHHDGSYIFIYISFPMLWLLMSVLTRKFRIGEKSNQREVFFSIIFSNFIILSGITLIMVLFQVTFFSRFVLFGTVAGITIFEIIAGHLFVSIQNSVFLKDWIGLEIPEEQSVVIAPAPHPEVLSVPRKFNVLRDAIIEESGEEAFTWIHSQMDITNPKNFILSTDTRFNIINHPTGFYTGLVNLQRINNLRRINKFFETVNTKLPEGGIFIGCVETYWLRKQRILAKFPPLINYLVYMVDFILNRVFPKLVMTRKLYFLITRGKNRVMSRTETLGRLYSCGFKITEEKPIGDLLYWKTQKIRTPYFDDTPNYGVLIRLRRIGLNGKEFNVYKLRTMHAYSEYIQGFVYESNQLDEGGKFKNDFRVTTIGRILRKFWLDELPMLLNIMKGNMKLVGVRPLSKHYFSLYSEELQIKRVKGKPGLIPPYYAQYPPPEKLEDIEKNEMEYLTAYEKHPFTTDVKYFFKAMYNILWKGARSK